MTKALTYLKTDPVMAELINQIGPIKLKPRRLPPYQSLIHSIIYQQLSGKAAATIYGRFEALFEPGRFPEPGTVLAATLEKIRTAGVSRSKASYILDVAQKSFDGLIPSLNACDQLCDEELIEKLTTIKGVGRWTAEMLLMFNLGRPDILPVHDLGIRKGYQIAYKKRRLPDPEKLQEFGKRWDPYRTTAAMYLWKAADGENN